MSSTFDDLHSFDFSSLLHLPSNLLKQDDSLGQSKPFPSSVPLSTKALGLLGLPSLSRKKGTSPRDGSFPTAKKMRGKRANTTMIPNERSDRDETRCDILKWES